MIGLYLQSVTGCAGEFPDLTDQLKNSWIKAFRRNGFDPHEQVYDEGVQRSWRKPTGDPQQRHECEKVIAFLSGKDFEEAVSEARIKNLLSPPR